MMTVVFLDLGSYLLITDQNNKQNTNIRPLGFGVVPKIRHENEQSRNAMLKPNRV